MLIFTCVFFLDQSGYISGVVFENEWVSVACIMCNSFPDSLLVSVAFMYYFWLDIAGVFENRKYSEEGLISKVTDPPFTAIFLLAGLLGGGGFFPAWSDTPVYVCWGILSLWKMLVLGNMGDKSAVSGIYLTHKHGGLSLTASEVRIKRINQKLAPSHLPTHCGNTITFTNNQRGTLELFHFN